MRARQQLRARKRARLAVGASALRTAPRCARRPRRAVAGWCGASRPRSETQARPTSSSNARTTVRQPWRGDACARSARECVTANELLGLARDADTTVILPAEHVLAPRERLVLDHLERRHVERVAEPKSEVTATVAATRRRSTRPPATVLDPRAVVAPGPPRAPRGWVSAGFASRPWFAPEADRAPRAGVSARSRSRWRRRRTSAAREHEHA
jgi:hypothetical protein